MRRPLPPQMRVPLGGLGRGPVCGDELLLRDWSMRHVLPVAARARFVTTSTQDVARAVAVMLLVICVAGAAEHWQVDQPSQWYRADVSHHGDHAAAGALIGVASYAAVRVVGGTRGDGIAVSVIDGAVGGFAYELAEGRSGRAWVDPVDALWTTAGAAVGAVTATITDRAIGVAIAVIPHRDGVGLAIAKTF